MKGKGDKSARRYVARFSFNFFLRNYLPCGETTESKPFLVQGATAKRSRVNSKSRTNAKPLHAVCTGGA